MSSEVDIANLALAHLGDEAGVISITPPDGTQQAAYCGTYYPLARDVLLEMHPWTFATKRASLALLETAPLDGEWGFSYALPSTCIRPLSTVQPGTPGYYFGNDDGNQPYIVEAAADGGPILYCNIEVPALRYIDLVTDTSRFTPGFVMALSRLLASYLAGPVIKGTTGIQVAQAQWKLFTVEYAKACAANANTGRRDGYQTRRPDFILARGGRLRWPYPGDWRNL